MTTTVRVLSGALEDGARRESVYSGAPIVFEKVPPMGEFCAFTDALIREVFGTTDPVRARFGLDRDEYLSRVEALQKRFRKDARTRDRSSRPSGTSAWTCGAPSGTGLTARLAPRRGTLGPPDRQAGLPPRHLVFQRVRADELGAPIYPVNSGRAIAFYPSYWSRPVKNTSGDWDLKEIQTGKSAAPVVPEPVEPVDTASELRVMPSCASPARTCTRACPTPRASPASPSRFGRSTPGT